MSLVNIKTAAELQAEAEAQAEAQEKFAELSRRTDPEKLLKALEVLAKASVDLDALEDPDEVVALYPEWHTTQTVKVGDVRAFEGVLYKVIQAHTTQSDWTPPAVPALWRRVKATNSNVWVPNIAVTVGEVYAYQNISYTVVQSHTTQVGWEPPNAPALWSVV